MLEKNIGARCLFEGTNDNYGAYINIEDRVPEDYTKGASFVILMKHDPQCEVTNEGVYKGILARSSEHG